MMWREVQILVYVSLVAGYIDFEGSVIFPGHQGIKDGDSSIHLWFIGELDAIHVMHLVEVCHNLKWIHLPFPNLFSHLTWWRLHWALLMFFHVRVGHCGHWATDGSALGLLIAFTTYGKYVVGRTKVNGSIILASEKFMYAWRVMSDSSLPYMILCASFIRTLVKRFTTSGEFKITPSSIMMSLMSLLKLSVFFHKILYFPHQRFEQVGKWS